MPNGLFTPKLVLQVAEAVEDNVVTPNELNEIIGTVTTIFAGVMLVGFVGMLTGTIYKGFTRETGIKIEERGGVPIPV